MNRKLLCLCLALLSFCGCEHYQTDHVDYNTIEIEGCEYLIVPTYGESVSITHKGNCKNPIHGHNH